MNGPGGLLLIDLAGTPAYPLAIAHGDIAGTTDVNGAFTANPATDAFGVGTPPANGLGWLGNDERFASSSSPDLVRMGVRIYGSSLGRFFEMDSVPGGCANDYVYLFADPINAKDLNGKGKSTIHPGCKVGETVIGTFVFGPKIGWGFGGGRLTLNASSYRMLASQLSAVSRELVRARSGTLSGRKGSVDRRPPDCALPGGIPRGAAPMPPAQLASVFDSEGSCAVEGEGMGPPRRLCPYRPVAAW